MKAINWNNDKNRLLKETREVSFEDVLFALDNDRLLDNVTHPHPERFENQQMLIVNIREYAYLVPFVETEEEIFLKTIIPNRQATKKYLSGGEQ